MPKEEEKEEFVDDADPEDYDKDFDKDFDEKYEDDAGKDEVEEGAEKEEYEPEPGDYDDFKADDDKAPPTMVLKLDVGESVEGRLVSVQKQTSTDKRGNTMVSMLYLILAPGESEPWRIYGTVVLDQWMKPKVVGDRLGIIREKDIPAKMAGRSPTQMYKTYTIHKIKKKPVERERRPERERQPERERRPVKKVKKSSRDERE